MYSRILVAIDGSVFNEQAASRAIMFAHDNQARLMLLHVCTDADNIATEDASDENSVKLSSIDLLRLYCDVIRRKGVIADLRAPSGDPGQQICEVAKQWDADLILMGHRDSSTLNKPALNSVGYYVLAHAPCSLLVVPDSINLPIAVAVQKVSAML